MLIVTFSRAATGELRERVRERLTSAELGLADPDRAIPRDPLLRLLADALRRTRSRCAVERLTRALAAFDAATIATTHQFCAQVLAGLGVTAELAALTGGDRFVESLDDLVTEVAEDLYLRKFAGRSTATARRRSSRTRPGRSPWMRCSGSRRRGWNPLRLRRIRWPACAAGWLRRSARR